MKATIELWIKISKLAYILLIKNNKNKGKLHKPIDKNKGVLSFDLVIWLFVNVHSN